MTPIQMMIVAWYDYDIPERRVTATRHAKGWFLGTRGGSQEMVGRYTGRPFGPYPAYLSRRVPNSAYGFFARRG